MSKVPRKKSANKTGRTDSAGEGHFTKMVRSVMDTPAWRALSPVAQSLYPWIKLEWHGARANNNGKIRFSVRQAGWAMGIANDTAARGFHDLQKKGFLVMRELPTLGLEGAAKSPAFELTEIAVNPAQVGTQKYREWKQGNDFEFYKPSPNNSSGLNGNPKPRPRKLDNHVLESGTKH